MNFVDIKMGDTRWTERERVIFGNLFRTRHRYMNENRKLEAHGVAKAIYVMANVIEALEAAKTVPDDPSKFHPLP